MRRLARRAADALREAGADYGDVRVESISTESLTFRSLRLSEAALRTEEGVGVRAVVDGCWGFASGTGLSDSCVDDVVSRAVSVARAGGVAGAGSVRLSREEVREGHFRGPCRQDPFEVSREDKIDLLTRVCENLHAPREVSVSYAGLWFEKRHRVFGNTEGTMVSSEIVFSQPLIRATAVHRGDAQSRSLQVGGRVAGWEWIRELDMAQTATRVGEEAVMKVRADEGPTGTMDLVLDGVHLGLTMHESVGHPTESDRALGWEANMAGKSFLKLSDRGSLRYGSPLVSFLADNTMQGGLATWGWDDEGVPGQRWYLVREGVFREFGTVRETAPELDEPTSRGCCRAQDFTHFPINRQPNLYLEPGDEGVTADDLISEVDRGIYIEGRGSFSIDQMRLNFQFGGDFFWEIRGGRKVRPLKKVIYRSTTPEFWGSCDGIAGPADFRRLGILTCGKGEPMQAARMTHGASHSRFRDIEVRGGSS
jgi:TldD protein